MPNHFAIQRRVQRMLNLKPENMYCDDFAQDVSLEERAARKARQNQQVNPSEKLGRYLIQNKETHERRFISVKDHNIMYDNSCAGCVLYNEESGEQKIVSQKEFEQAYFKWGTN